MSRPAGPYVNAPMTRAEGEAILLDLGMLLSARDASGRAIPGTACLGLCGRGPGQSVVVPAELLAGAFAREYDRGRVDGRNERIGDILEAIEEAIAP